MKNNRQVVSILSVIIGILVVAVGVFLVLRFRDSQSTLGLATEETESTDMTQSSKEAAPGKEITWEGKDYVYNTDIRNILFLGVDKKNEEMETQEYAGRGGQADCIILLSLNTKEKTAAMLNISRDSMTDIDIYDMSGDFIGTQKAQLALQYAYGDGEKRSCWLMKKAVADLLNDIPIHGYMALNIDGISIINDVLGGVEITIPSDYTSIDEAFVEGKTLTLSGSQAERYVRYRDINELGSNNGRMERQNQFLKALVRLLKEKTSENSNLINTLFTAGKPYMTTDLTAEQMEEYASYTLDDTFIKVPGETQEGEAHDEYIVDEKKLMDVLIKMLYKES